MARYFDVHPDNPQPRAIAVAEIVRGEADYPRFPGTRSVVAWGIGGLGCVG
jgi:hypothetical protein